MGYYPKPYAPWKELEALLLTPLRGLTKEALEKQHAKRKSLEAEAAELAGTDATALWNADLDVVEGLVEEMQRLGQASPQGKKPRKPRARKAAA